FFFIFCFLGTNKNNFSVEIVKASPTISKLIENKNITTFVNNPTKILKTKSDRIEPESSKGNIESNFSEDLSLNKTIDSNNNSTSDMCVNKHENKVTNQWQEFEWIKNIGQHFTYLIHHKDFDKKEINVVKANEKRSQFSYQIYATPSMDYRYVNNTNLQKPIDSNKGSMRVNFEAGGAILMNVSKYFRIKAGMQLNFSQLGNNATINNNDKSNAASMYNSVALVNKKFNNTSNIFKNSTYQVSIPIGTEFEIMSHNKLKWYAGATIQPSYLFVNNDQSVFTELNNQVYQQSMMREWNVNSSIETFINYDLKNNIELNVGPQIRYQFLSTYKNAFQQNERLYQFGLKIGICKKL
ncbi:MAG: hypothetical protein NT127_05925, partial [Sphingobacteriales bacterium]|nr:hypothetical protein [Sphingobacteriales bacterium]